MERIYCTINEGTARRAKEMNSFNSYVPGSETESYKQVVNAFYDKAEKALSINPNESEKIINLAYRYARQYAEWINKGFSIDCMCPSVMISGPSNFPIQKKERQNNRRNFQMSEYEKFEKMEDKLRSIVHGANIIKSNDPEVIEKLKLKLEKLEKLQLDMKAVNAYYRKNKSLVGCEVITNNQIEKLEIEMSESCRNKPKPFESFELTNNNAVIRNTKQRLESLQKIKASDSFSVSVTDTEKNELFKVVENIELMRLQLLFDSKPEEEIRTVLKKNGFKWAPSQNAWQRQLTNNAKHSLRRVKEQLIAK